VRSTLRLSGLAPVVRIALAVFVLAWIFGPQALRAGVPIWLPFLIAVALEVNFLIGAIRPGPERTPDRAPQQVDRERYGYELEGDAGVDAGLETFREPPARSLAGRFIMGLGLITALAALVWIVESRSGWDSLSGETRGRAVARFSDEAARIAQKPVTLRCDESRDYVGLVQHADGVAEVGGDRAYLTPERCFDLYRLAFRGEVTWSQTSRALAVLAHEAWHLRGVHDEATTECYALQSAVELGVRLGLSEDDAGRMMRQQLTENALRGAAGSEYVVSGECKEGGRLDLHRDSGRFP
jgi:hypothetical protein